MNNFIEAGCLAEIVGSQTIADGTVVQVMTLSHEDNGMPAWILDQKFPDVNGEMTDICYEHYLRRIDIDEKEVCTTWEDVKTVTGWVPDRLKNRHP